MEERRGGLYTHLRPFPLAFGEMAHTMSDEADGGFPNFCRRNHDLIPHSKIYHMPSFRGP